MTDTTKDNTAQGVEVVKPNSIWKTISKSTIDHPVPFFKGEDAKEQQQQVIEVVEACEIPQIGVIVKTVLYDEHLSTVSTLLVSSARLELDRLRSTDELELYSIKR